MSTRRCYGWCCGRTAAVVAMALVFAAAEVAAVADEPDVSGVYCAARPRGCCAGRQDDCSAPILGTLCYCDDFCNHTRNEDCCPDFWSFCKGIESPKPVEIRTLCPIDACSNDTDTDRFRYPKSFQLCCHECYTGCYANGQIYKYGETVTSNCNECRCEEANGKMQLMCSSDECLIDPYLLDTFRHQARQFGWSAGNYSEYWGKRYDEGLKYRLGTLYSKKKILQMKPLKAAFRRDSLPRSYDAREVWAKYVSQPIDQGWCGASWAITTVQVTNDRFGIMSKGAIGDPLSAQHLLSCSVHSQQGCQGGHLTRAWNWIRKFGLVKEECYPWEGRMSECSVPKKKKELTAPCPRLSRSNRPSRTQLHRVGPVYRVATEQGIMYEIMTSGPVQAVMKVSRDFFMYKSGVYKCSNLASGSRTGYHSVRIVGWGEEYQNGKIVKYWIASNSWGRWWGEDGYFRIQKGTNECHVEDFVIAAWADIDDFNVTVLPQGYEVFLRSQDRRPKVDTV